MAYKSTGERTGLLEKVLVPIGYIFGFFFGGSILLAIFSGLDDLLWRPGQNDLIRILGTTAVGGIVWWILREFTNDQDK